MASKKIKVRLRPIFGYLCVTTPSISLILQSGEVVEVDTEIYEKKLRRYVDVVTTKEKKEKSEKKTESFFFKED